MGFLSKLFGGKEKTKAEEKPKIIKNGDWEVYLRADGTPYDFYKKGKEWMDSSHVWASPSGKYYIHDGYNEDGDSCVAITTQAEGIKLYKTNYEDTFTAFVTDDPVGYLLTTEGNLFTLNPEKSGRRTLRFNDEDPEKVILTPMVAAAVYDNMEDTVTVKGIELSTGKAWRKSVKYKEPETYGDREVELEKTDNGIKVTLQDGTEHAFTADGVPE